MIVVRVHVVDTETGEILDEFSVAGKDPEDVLRKANETFKKRPVSQTNQAVREYLERWEKVEKHFREKYPEAHETGEPTEFDEEDEEVEREFLENSRIELMITFQ